MWCISSCLQQASYVIQSVLALQRMCTYHSWSDSYSNLKKYLWESKIYQGVIDLANQSVKRHLAFPLYYFDTFHLTTTTLRSRSMCFQRWNPDRFTVFEVKVGWTKFNSVQLEISWDCAYNKPNYDIINQMHYFLFTWKRCPKVNY